MPGLKIHSSVSMHGGTLLSSYMRPLLAPQDDRIEQVTYDTQVNGLNSYSTGTLQNAEVIADGTLQSCGSGRRVAIGLQKEVH